MTLAEYYDALASHDWLYSYSDDPSVYRRGSSEESRLRATAKQSEAHGRLFDEYEHWALRRQNRDDPRPERPKEEN